MHLQVFIFEKEVIYVRFYLSLPAVNEKALRYKLRVLTFKNAIANFSKVLTKFI